MGTMNSSTRDASMTGDQRSEFVEGKMDAELKRKWVDALRSGKYQQARGILKGDDGFCCIGVFCDLQGIDWNGDFDRAVSVPPEPYRAGLTSSDFLPLANMNDSEERSFAEIADYIEEHL